MDCNDYTQCAACGLDFLSDHEDDELCPECEEGMTEGDSIVLLGHKDCAFVLREDGSHQIYFGEEEDEGRKCTDLELAIVTLGFRYLSPEFKTDCEDVRQAALILEESEKEGGIK
jgi:hypothetical protein